MTRTLVIVLSIVSAAVSCTSTKQLVYIDEWEGEYKLREYSSCCDTATNVRLVLNKISNDNYIWKMFFKSLNDTDTIIGKAIYLSKQLKFYVNNGSIADKYFGKPVQINKAIFWMEFSNYYSDKEYKFVDYFTKWNNELKNYKAKNRFAAGVHYHFKKEGIKERKIENKVT